MLGLQLLFCLNIVLNPMIWLGWWNQSWTEGQNLHWWLSRCVLLSKQRHTLQTCTCSLKNKNTTFTMNSPHGCRWDLSIWIILYFCNVKKLFCLFYSQVVQMQAMYRESAMILNQLGITEELLIAESARLDALDTLKVVSGIHCVARSNGIETLCTRI